MVDRAINYQPLAKLQEAGDPRNPRAHESLDLVQDSIQELGYLESIIRDDRTGNLIAGHGRVKALIRMRDAGQSPPDGVTAGEDDWLVPVTVGWASRSDEDAARAIIVLNRAAEQAGWDDAALQELLDELDATDQGIALTGFTEADRERLQRLAEASGRELDAMAEWAAAGMPDYESNDLQAAYRTVVHFPTERDADEFFKLVGREKAKFFWWPQTDGHKGSDSHVQVVADEA